MAFALASPPSFPQLSEEFTLLKEPRYLCLTFSDDPPNKLKFSLGWELHNSPQNPTLTTHLSVHLLSFPCLITVIINNYHY